MANHPRPDEILKSIRTALLQEASELGMFIETHKTRPPSEKVLQDLHSDPELNESFLRGAETGQLIKTLRERES